MDVVIFNMAGRQLAVEVSRVREVVNPGKITPIPDIPPYIKGVINYRGEVVVIVSLAEKFGFQDSTEDASSRAIIYKVGDRTVGFLVQEITEVTSFNREEVETPDGVLKDAGYLDGVVRFRDGLVLLMDMAKTLAEEDLIDLDEIIERVEIIFSEKE